MNFLIKTGILFTIIFSLSSCVSPTIKKDMVLFDEAFIPAWYYAYKGDLDNSRRAILPLLHTWKHFEKKYTAQLIANEDRSESMRRVGIWLEEANCAILDDEVSRATVHLDHARYEMMELRYLIEIEDYYMDQVWDLENAIALLIDYATDDMLGLLEWEEFEEVADDMKKAWKVVLSAPVEPELYTLNEEQLLKLAENKLRLNIAMDNFYKELETADGRCFGPAAEDIKPAYIDFVNVFGNYEAIQTYYAFAK